MVNDTINDTINGTINDTINDTIKLSDIDLTILDIIKIDKFSTRKKVAEKIGCSEVTVSRALENLAKEGVIKREGSKKAGKWIALKEKGC